MNKVHIECFVDNRFALENKGITIQYTMVHERLISLGTDHKKTWGGGAKYKNNIRARENYMKKNSCTPINPKKYSFYGLKKNSYKEFDDVKKFLRLENSPPAPITLLIVRPLISVIFKRRKML